MGCNAALLTLPSLLYCQSHAIYVLFALLLLLFPGKLLKNVDVERKNM